MYKLLMRKYRILMDTTPKISNDSGMFKTVEKPASKMLGDLGYIGLQILGGISIISAIGCLIAIVVAPEYRKKAGIGFLLSVFFVLMVYGGALKDFLTGIGS